MTANVTVFVRTTSMNSFTRAQASSIFATALDYGTLFLLAEIFHVWYVASTAWGALAGAIANFSLNRHWTFQAADGHLGVQAIRYAFVSIGSLILNTFGVYCVTEYLHLHYAISVVLVSLGVGVLFNYPLHRYYVYRIGSTHETSPDHHSSSRS